MGRMAEAGPATELSSQTGPLPKPDATNPSRTSGSLLGPCSTDLDRSRFLRIGAGQDVSESDGAEVHTRRTWAGANPETELPSQTGRPRSRKGRFRVRRNGGQHTPRSTDPDRNQSQAGLEPDGPCPSRTKREPIRPMLDEPGSEPDQ